jgi:hypothetical protein
MQIQTWLVKLKAYLPVQTDGPSTWSRYDCVKVLYCRQLKACLCEPMARDLFVTSCVLRSVAQSCHAMSYIGEHELAL